MKKIDPRLKTVLRNFAESYLQKREAALTGIDFELRRDELARVKDKTLQDLEKWLELFETRARQKGARIYRARDGLEANKLVLKILKQAGASYLVKSKSMVSEETGLNAFLAVNGVEVRETDLGEWIVQLADEAPSHMVMPAIHLTREDVARLFSKRLKKAVPGDIPFLIRLAREELRRDIWRAGAGLIGANALIAENGSVMLITNEGNGRLVSVLPPVRIVLASIEKVWPSVKDALLLLKLLPPNATGQMITSYVSFLTPSPENPLDIILLDNHRSEILADPVFKEILRCIKCSACLNVCPVYQVVGGKRYGHVYMGGIGSLLTAWMHGLKQSRELADLCLGCHRCEAFCAAKIPIAGLIVSLREHLNLKLGKTFLKRLVFDGAMAEVAIWRKLFSVAGAARPIIAGKDGFTRRLSWPLQKYDRHRAVPAPAGLSLSERVRKDVKLSKINKRQAKIIVFGGCLVEYFYPQVGEAALRVLAKLDREARLARPACCGFPAASAGFRAAAARTFERAFEDLRDAEHVLTLCPTCTTMLKHLGPEILGTEAAKDMAKTVSPVGRFILDSARTRLEALLPSDSVTSAVTYHDSCHHNYVLGASLDSRTVVELALGKKILEMDKPDACCGFAGFFSVSHPEISASLLEDKLESIRRCGADVVALDCPGCLLQIQGGCRASQTPAVAKHTIEIIEARLAGKL